MMLPLFADNVSKILSALNSNMLAYHNLGGDPKTPHEIMEKQQNIEVLRTEFHYKSFCNISLWKIPEMHKFLVSDSEYKDVTKAFIDVVTHDLLKSFDLTPEAVLTGTAIHSPKKLRFMTGYGTEDRKDIIETALHRQNVNTRLVAEVMLDDKVWWKNNGISIRKELPKSRLLQMKGKPLKDLISHPVLDEHPLTIIDLDETRIEVGYIPMRRVFRDPFMRNQIVGDPRYTCGIEAPEVY